MRALVLLLGVVGGQFMAGGAWDFPLNTVPIGPAVEFSSSLGNSTNGTRLLELNIGKRQEGYLIFGLPNDSVFNSVIYITRGYENGKEGVVLKTKRFASDAYDFAADDVEQVWRLEKVRVNSYTHNWYVKISRNVSDEQVAPWENLFREVYLEYGEDDERPATWQTSQLIFTGFATVQLGGAARAFAALATALAALAL